MSQGDLDRRGALRRDADRSTYLRGLVHAAAVTAGMSVPPSPEKLHLATLRILSTTG